MVQHQHAAGGDEAEWTGLELCLAAIVQLALVLVAYRLEKASSPSLLSESAVAMGFGVLFGIFLKAFYPSRAQGEGFNPQVLFFGLLPPIILEAGFNMKKRGFFANFSTILLLAIAGTLIATFVTGGVLIWCGQRGWITKLSPAEAYLYGALISAVDPVATLSVFKKNGTPSMLFNLVFGESMLNDGVAIVAFTLFQQMIRHEDTDVTMNDAILVIFEVIGIGLGSVLLAALVCCTSAFILNHADSMLQQFPNYEISIVLLSAYLSYVVADIAGLSGIVALFFSGVLISHYHFYCIAQESATTLRHLLTTSAFLAENFIFIYLGVSVVVDSGYFTWDWWFIAINLVACVVGRFLNVFPLCWIANCRRKEEIPVSFMVVMWFAGLRGAIAFALALNVWTPDQKHSQVIQSSTLFTVMFTTLVFGMGTTPLLKHFNLVSTPEASHRFDDSSVTESLLPSHPEEEEDDDSPRAKRRHDIEDRDFFSRGGVHGAWEQFDEKYLKPLFGGRPRPAYDPKQISARQEASHMTLTDIARNHDEEANRF